MDESSAAQISVAVRTIRVAPSGDAYRMVIDIDGRTSYAIQTGRQKVSIVLKETEHFQLPQALLTNLKRKKHPLLKDIKLSRTRQTGVQVDVLFFHPVTLVRHFTLDPDKTANKPFRIVCDFAHSPDLKKGQKPHKPPHHSTWDKAIKEQLRTPTALYPAYLSLPKAKPQGINRHTPPLPKPIIVIDAGHGGEDPGAISVNGEYEKTITLVFAQEIQRHLMQTGCYKVILTRANDIFIPLKERVQQARASKGDLFISLHADSHPNPQMHGFSIYTLSQLASDKEAEILAARENKADIICGIDLGKEQKEVANILLDLTQRETMNRSKLFAKMVIDTLSQRGYRSLIPNAHRSAAFVVLKAQDIPSVLIELGYLSNKKDLAFLTHKKQQEKLSRDIVKAIESFFKQVKA